MQQNRELLKEIKDNTKPSFIPSSVLRAHKNIAQTYKFKARNENAVTINDALDSMTDTLYNLIRNNRNNRTQKIQISITERFSKPEEILSDRDLVDPVTGIVHRRGTIYIPTNREIEDNKYHESNVFTLYCRPSIRRLLDNLTIINSKKRR